MKHKNKQLVILIAGKGTRLYPLTIGFPKCLLSIKQKPAIYNMIIPLIKEGLRDIIFVVNNDNINIIKDFMERSFSNIKLNIKYIIQNDFSGPGSALSLVADKITEDKSVILLLGDTLCTYPDNYDNSWIGVSSVDDEKSKYCMIESNSNKITNIFDKPEINVDTNDAAIGLYYFKNSKLLSSVLNEKIEKIHGEYQLSSYFQKYHEHENICIQKINDWEDIGSLDGYMKTNKNNFNCRFFNTLYLDQLGVLHKKSIYPKITSEINWFKYTKNTDFEKTSPKFYDSDRFQDEYGIEFYDYLTLSEYFTFYPLSEYSKIYIFTSLMEKMIDLYKSNQLNDEKFKKLLKAILIDKTYNRINEWARTDIINKEKVFINNQEYYGIFPLLERLENSILEICENSINYISIIHGDPAFSNILFSPRNMLFKLIDPRGDFGIDTIYGDYRYDLAKIRHCYHGRYDEITNDLFEISEITTNDKCDINLKFYKDLEYLSLDRVLVEKGFNVDDIELIEGLLFISMLPLHNDYPDRQIAFFSRGIEILNNQLERRNLNE